MNTYHGVCEKLHENYDLGFHRQGVATSSTCENTGCDPEILVRKIVEYVCDERDEQTLFWDRANSRLSDMETELSTEEKPAATSPTKGHQHQQPQPGATTTAASSSSEHRQQQPTDDLTEVECKTWYDASKEEQDKLEEEISELVRFMELHTINPKQGDHSTEEEITPDGKQTPAANCEIFNCHRSGCQ